MFERFFFPWEMGRVAPSHSMFEEGQDDLPDTPRALLLTAVCVAQERYWEEHPGQAVPTMRSWTYLGPHKVRREDFAEEEGRE